MKTFISGTKSDIGTEREAVIRLFNYLKLSVESMEFFGSTVNEPIETCLNMVNLCDIFILIIAHKYGTIEPKEGRSFTELEYNQAYKKGKPCLVFMLNSNVPIIPSNMESDPSKMEHLNRFKKILCHRHTISCYVDTSDLVSLIAASIFNIIKTNDTYKESPIVEGFSRNEIGILELSKLQKGDNLSEVWVYAPLPLEDISGGDNDLLAKQVFDNIVNGIKYTYFVESYEGIDRILKLAKDLNTKFITPNEINSSKKLYDNIYIIVLEPDMFLTYYTLHHFQGGLVDVYQSVITFDRKDKLTKLDQYSSIKVFDLIKERTKKHKAIRLSDIIVK